MASLRVEPTTAPLVRFEGLPGEFSQHDFGHIDIGYLDRTRERIHFFASRLKYSRWSEVRLVTDERVESLVRALLSSFEAFGGVPLVGVFDNPKTIVLSRSKSKIEWNATFGQVALDYRFAPELCAPRRANQKGSVENLVGWVKGSFFKVRRFHDREDMVRQLAEWHTEVNEERPSRATGVTPAERMAAERERLRPLSQPPEEYALHLYRDRVRIVARKHQSEHPRLTEPGAKSILPEHLERDLSRFASAACQTRSGPSSCSESPR